MSAWIVAAIGVDLRERLFPAHALQQSAWTRLRALPRPVVGMMMAHLGVAAFAFGVSMVRSYEVEHDVKMQVGDTTEVAGYTFQLKGLRNVRGPNYDGVQALVEVTRGGGAPLQMFPEKRMFRVQGTAMTEAAIDRNPLRDLYVSLGELVDGDAWIVRVYVKPFVDWIWFGCALMALGGALAASDRRYRAKQTRSATLPGTNAGEVVA